MYVYEIREIAENPFVCNVVCRHILEATMCVHMLTDIGMISSDVPILISCEGPLSDFLTDGQHPKRSNCDAPKIAGICVMHPNGCPRDTIPCPAPEAS